MRTAGIVALAAIAASCSSGPPAHEVQRFHAFSFDRDLASVREACRAGLKEERCPIESDTETGLSTPMVEDVGFAWRLTVDLRPGTGFVTVEPSLEIRRSADYEPPRRVRSASLYDDASTRSAGREGSLTERQIASRGSGDPLNERENRIRELERRVNRFVDVVAHRLSAKP
jgi:hypothetical protein